MSKPIPRIQSIRCIVGACGRVAEPRHAICRRHLALEVLVLGGIALLGCSAIVAAAIKWGSR